jgi:hypothetical protein
MNQYETSKKLGISDASVSGYRKTIERILKHLDITTVVEAMHFKKALTERIKENLGDI